MQPGKGVSGEGLKLLSIAWFAQQRRGAILARRLGAEFIPLACTYYRSPLARVLEYRRLQHQTLRILRERRPDGVLVQVPPVPAAVAVSQYAEKAGVLFVIDAHSGPFLDQGFTAGFYRRQLQQAGRRALVTLLHNTGLIPYAEALGMNWFILEDPVPECPVFEVPAVKSNEVTVVCGYGRDEPVPVVLQAVRLLPESRFYFTGRMPAHYRLPPNAVATGYLSERDYWQRLRSSGVIVALTTREATALGAAYDALAVERPMVLSRTQALECLFPKGAVLVDNHPEAIAAGIQQALRHAEELITRGRELRQEKARSWERQLAALVRLMTERHILR